MWFSVTLILFLCHPTTAALLEKKNPTQHQNSRPELRLSHKKTKHPFNLSSYYIAIFSSFDLRTMARICLRLGCFQGPSALLHLVSAEQVFSLFTASWSKSQLLAAQHPTTLMMALIRLANLTPSVNWEVGVTWGELDEGLQFIYSWGSSSLKQ